MESEKHILSLNYLPCISWFHELLKNETIIDIHEYYIKQSYRNRTHILTANGVYSLTIPVKNKNHTPINNLAIENDFNWQKNHWDTITSAYRSAPYFSHYEPYFEQHYLSQYNFLVDFNKALIKLCLRLLKVEVELKFSETYLSGKNDLREKIHPKKSPHYISKKYMQVFSDRFEFKADLSILDLIFNCGPDAISYL